ncbi:hypothetical protein ACSIGC_16330 [Tenacibaculum sp. ZS6-P6]|uniref:hypothetical protein n=1 Tax=Tenacibaculum sp. ZS6-P6 TaxID=3447503 RepID=UPI003F9827E6
MRKLLILVIFLKICSCKEVNSNKKITTKDNLELINIYNDDQNERKIDTIDWHNLHRNDSIRRIRVQQLLDSGKIKTGKDYARAAMIFQHARDDSVSYAKTVELIKKAIAIDSTINKSLYAAAIDRYLLSIGKPQIYGTQFFKEEGKPWIQENYDSLKVDDQERKKYGVKTLKEQKEALKKMNNQ